MTQLIKVLCKTCKKTYGPLGLHGSSFESLMKCTKCKDLFVLSNEDKTCPNCKSFVMLFDACPNCSSKNTFYRDMNLPDTPIWIKFKTPFSCEHTTETKIYEAGIEECSKPGIMFGNLVMIVWIALGAFALSILSPIIAIIYALFAVIMIVFVLRKLLCTNCYYYGKWCHIGWGKLATLFFKKGDQSKFKTSIGQKVAPVTYGILTLLPLLILIFSMFQQFSFLKLGIFIGILIVGGYSGGIARKKACNECKMKLNCPNCAA